jgi:predicted kinase
VCGERVNMATLHLMIGLPCSGKTTYARRLAGETSALVLTLDVWHLQLFGDDVGDERHDERHMRIEKIMWDVARHVLVLGGDVILDYGCWARVERDDYRNRAKELGAEFKLHYMDVPYAELYRRLEERNRNRPEGVFEISKAEMDRYVIIFQPPAKDELV